jgi:hypothetical protein
VIRARSLLLLGALAAGAAGLSSCAPAEFDVAVFGDVPYSPEDVPRYNRMITAINGTDVRFSSHVGDIGRDDPDPCLNSTVDTETNRMDTFERPLVYTPGDNEWADCSNDVARLEYLRSRIFRGTGTQSRGQTRLALTSQDSRGFPENATWQSGAVTFVTIHVVGSKDNGLNSTGFAARRQANIDWLAAAFDAAEARGDKGVMIIAQDHPNLDNKASADGAAAYQSMRDAVIREVRAFSGQVLYIHGDGHTYKNVKPEAGLANLRRVQVEGDSKVSYVPVRVAAGSSAVFTVSSPVGF